MNKITLLTYRKDSGPSGGPGGVLHVQKQILGEADSDYSYEYHFMPEEQPAGCRATFFERALQKAGFGPFNAGAIPFAYKIGRNRSNQLFVTHDMGSAVGLALAGANYILAYHQQGSLANEHKSLHGGIKLKNIICFGILEAVAFKGAILTVFPSQGALVEVCNQSNALRKWLIRHGADRAKIINNTITENVAPPDIEQIRFLDPIPKNKLVLLSVGALTEVKGIDRIPALLGSFKQAGLENWVWVCIGTGPLEQRIRNECQSHNISAQCIFITDRIHHASLLKVYARASIYIMLHRLSIFDFATLEAMRAGCALVLSNSSGNTDFDRADNIVFWDGDNTKTARSITSQYKRLGDLNQKTFSSEFSPAVFKERYKRVFNDAFRILSLAGNMK